MEISELVIALFAGTVGTPASPQQQQLGACRGGVCLDLAIVSLSRHLVGLPRENVFWNRRIIIIVSD